MIIITLFRKEYKIRPILYAGRFGAIVIMSRILNAKDAVFHETIFRKTA